MTLVANTTPAAIYNFDMLPDDAVMPVQFYDTIKLSSPEKKLLFSVLIEAWRTLKTPYRTKAREVAEEWFASDSDEGVFTFVSVCDALEIAHQPMRRYALAEEVTVRNRRVSSFDKGRPR